MDIRLRNYSYKIDPGQNRLYWESINAGHWESHSFDIFDHFIHENANVLDIGSWSGVVTLYIANKANKVYALDPDPVCFEELLTNIKLNPKLLNKISAHQTAISDKKEEVILSARSQYGASSTSILNRKRDTENSIKITTIDLLSFVKKEAITKIDFIKMDVEGAEFQILASIGTALTALNYPTLYVSFHYHFLVEDIYHQYMPSRILNKLFLKLEKTLGFSFFKKKINKKIANIYDHVWAYEYIYTTDGNRVAKDVLKKQPTFIKNHDLVFTNIEWNKNDI